MADTTVLRCWPACVEAIDWSSDGIIALASDERVELLFPNTVDFERNQILPQWQHVALKVPSFSTDELPFKEPAPAQNYSVGEEISNNAPINIAWSPPGLAKHRRCGLAALTTGLILSIWSDEGRPQEESSWARRLIVNDALMQYFTEYDEEPSHLTMRPKEQLRLRSRIRAFAWAPALPCPEPAGVIGTRLLYGQHLIALSNDDNQLVIVLVESPTSTLGAEREWRAEVLTHDTLIPDSESIFSQPIVLEDMIKQQRYISHIAWSPWIVRGDWYHSVLVYATNEDVRAKVITYTHDSVGLGDEVVYAGIEMRNDGPMKWFPKVEDGEKLKLALFTSSGLIYLTISVQDASIIEKTTHDLDGRWDAISGVVWDTPADAAPRLHVSSLLSTLHSPTTVIELSSDGLKTLGTPSWREKIENNMALFSVKNGLKGNSKARVWGLTISPLGDYIAACNTVHPSDMIEYGIPADRRVTVAISSLRCSTQQRDVFTKDMVSAEGVLHTLKKLAENTVEDPDELSTFAEDIVKELLEAYTAPVISEDNTNTSNLDANSSDINVLITIFKKVAFLNSETLEDRYTILVAHACRAGSSIDLQKTLIAYRLAGALQHLPPSLSNTPFSSEIRAQHRQLIALIDTIMARGDAPEVSAIDDEASNDPSDGDSAPTNPTVPIIYQDTCDICSAPIPFTDLNTATCTNGHEAPRCGLSFLAIQAPGITKYCGICSTPFLSDEFVMAQEYTDGKKDGANEDHVVITGVIEDGGAAMRGGRGGDLEDEEQYEVDDESDEDDDDDDDSIEDSTEDDDESVETRDLPVTLARVLFFACDACIYCGGKFVG
ncbi:TFIIIC-delta multi-domain protein [Pyrenophora tritici-repentis]|nr:TFIIIC-delta multi-domain protein [Pyrenophora tritici-repentis]